MIIALIAMLFAPSEVTTWTFVHGNATGGEILVLIKRDGQIEYGPRYHPDDAMRLFWERCAPETVQPTRALSSRGRAVKPAPRYVITSCARIPGARLSRLGDWGNRRFDSVEDAEAAAVAMGAERGDIARERGR